VLQELKLALCIQLTDAALLSVAAHLAPTLRVLSLHRQAHVCLKVPI